MVLSMRTCNYQAFEGNSSVRLFFKTNPTHCRKVREKKFFIQSDKIFLSNYKPFIITIDFYNHVAYCVMVSIFKHTVDNEIFLIEIVLDRGITSLFL